MRIECDSCAARYSIADEKVIGKLYRVKCKKCGNMIMVDGTHLASPEEAEEATRVFDMNAASQDAQAELSDGESDAVWYVVIDGAEAGPLDESEIQAQLQTGSVDSETLAWCEGMGNWEPLGTIEAFAGMFAGAPGGDFDDGGFEDEATRVVDTSAEERTFNFGGPSATASGMSNFRSGGFAAAAPAPQPEPPAPSAPVSFDPPAARPTATSGAAEATFTAPASAPSSGTDSAGLGQRNESSVLFSLSELTANQGSAKKDELPRTEASGLIDIRVLSSTMAMPAQSSGSASAAGGSGGGPMPSSPMPMAPLIPVQPRKTSPAIIAALVVGGVAIVGLLVALVVLMSKEDPVTPVASAPSADPTAVAAAAPAPSTEEEAAGGAAQAEVEPEAAPAEVAEGSSEPAGDSETEVAEATEPGADEGAEPGEGQEAPEAPAEDGGSEQRVAAASPSRSDSSGSTRSDSGSTREREPERVVASASRSAPAPERTERAAPTPSTDRDRPRGDDAVNSALSAIRRNQPEEEPAARPSRPSEQRAARTEPAAEGLSRSQVQSTIRRYSSQVNACKTSEDQSGTYRVRFIIQPSGRVSNAQADDRGDVGRCLVNVVRDMTFPSFQGDPQPVPPYPFRL